MIKSDDGYAKSTVDDVPSRYIVDNRSYIDNSLTTLKVKRIMHHLTEVCFTSRPSRYA